MQFHLIIIIVIGCFAIVYPKLHPVLMNVLYGKQAQEPAKNIDDIITQTVETQYSSHPHDGMVPPRPPLEAPSVGGGGGGGIGAMALVLPVYAVGVVIYLVYTLARVFGGKTKWTNDSRKAEILRQYYRDFHYDPNRKEFRMGHGDFPEDNDQEEDMFASYNQMAAHACRRAGYPIPENSRGPRQMPSSDYFQESSTNHMPRMEPEDEECFAPGYYQSNEQDLEVLLERVEKKNITRDEIQTLQTKLNETERKMSRILEAMNRVKNIDFSELASAHVNNSNEEQNNATEHQFDRACFIEDEDNEADSELEHDQSFAYRRHDPLPS